MEPGCKARSIEFSSFSSFILSRLRVYEGKGQQEEQRMGEVSLYPSTSPHPCWVVASTVGEGVSSIPARTLWPGKSQSLSDTEISGSFPGKSHQDSEATLKACLITITNVHGVLAACWALRAPQAFTCTSFNNAVREVVLSLSPWLQMGNRRYWKNDELTA